jgi:hypothetical protein
MSRGGSPKVVVVAAILSVVAACAEWIVEGLRAGQYRVISGWSPDAGPFYDLGWCFLQLTGLESTTPVY